MKYNDIVSRATDFCLQSRVNFNPYLPLCSENRCVTLPPSIGERIQADKGENIYRYHREELGKFYHHKSNLQRDDINAKLLLAIKDGHPGSSTDYAGGIILTYFRNDPEGFDNLFYSSNSRLTPSVIIARILELPEKVTAPFNKMSDDMFDTKGGDINDPRYHESTLRKLLGKYS